MAQFVDRPLIVIALGGNAISPPGQATYAAERSSVSDCIEELGVFGTNFRLLIVHGNGPQVGRLMAVDRAVDNLDVHIAQTQGELGYLVVCALERTFPVDQSVAIVTRARVAADLAELPAVKAVGAVLAERPSGPAARSQGGWRRLVKSPEPASLTELPAITNLIRSHHVVAGGGGGVPIGKDDQRLECVIDKDWIAGLLASELGAERIVYVTNTDGAKDADGSRCEILTPAAARALIADQTARPGSMAPKLESAARFVEATGRNAYVAQVGKVRDTLEGSAGTRIASR